MSEIGSLFSKNLNLSKKYFINIGGKYSRLVWAGISYCLLVFVLFFWLQIVLSPIKRALHQFSYLSKDEILETSKETIERVIYQRILFYCQIFFLLMTGKNNSNVQIILKCRRRRSQLCRLTSSIFLSLKR